MRLRKNAMKIPSPTAASAAATDKISVAAMTLMGSRRSPNARFAGTARLRDLDLITATDDQLRGVRGEDISMIFQEPMTSLNPVFSVGYLQREAIMLHQNPNEDEARAQTVDILQKWACPIQIELRRVTRTSFRAGCVSAR